MNVPKLRFKEFTGEWETIPAKDLFENISEKNFPSETVLTIIQGQGTIPRSESGRDISFDEKSTSNYKKVLKNDFIIHLRSFEAGLEIANSSGIVSPAYTVLRNKEPIGILFYRNYFRSNKFINQTLCSAVEGVRDGRQIRFEQFKNISLVYTKLEEQEKISAFLNVVDEKIVNQQAIVESLEKQKKGLMQKIFSQELRFKDDDGKEFPDWEEKKLGEVGALKNGIAKGKEFFGTGKKFINLQDVFGKTKLYFNDYGLVEVTDKELEENNLIKGDVLFVRSSVKPEGVGLPCVVMEDLLDTVFSGFIIRCRFYDTSIIDIDYSTYCFLESNFRTELLKKSSSSANTNINQDNLANLKFKLPCIKEQQKIAEVLSTLDAKMELENKRLEHWEQIKKGLLQQMFV